MRLTKQQTFNKVATHLLTQNSKALNNYGGCNYKNDIGLKCAAGCLIPDDIYNKDVEGGQVDCMENFDRPELFKSLVTSLNFLKELQNLHDHQLVMDWKQKLRNLAIKHKLSYTMLRKFK